MLSTGITTIKKEKKQHILYYKNINIAIERKQTKTKHLKMNKIVASYDSLRYCQCDIGRKQNEKTNRTTYFMQAADVTRRTGRGKIAKTSGKSYKCSTGSESVKVESWKGVCEGG